MKFFRSEDPVLRPSAVVLWATAGILLAVGLTAGLLVVYRNMDPQRVSTWLDIVRIGLSVGAGTGGLFALWLASRRQRSAEQTLVLQREVSRSTVTDSTERRITDQYSKAIDQLGHEKAAVRLGAIYSLERIAQDHSGHRQTVVDVFCSYLRLPFAVPGGIGEGGEPVKGEYDDADELEVRRTVQSMIWAHLGDPEKRNFKDKFWPGISLDLSRTILVDPIFRHLSVRSLKCEGTVVHGLADFQGIKAAEVSGFGKVKFYGKTTLAGSVFRNGLALISSNFSDELDLSGVSVSRPFSVGHCHFGGKVVLTGNPSGGLMLNNCVFEKDLFLNDGKFDLLFVYKSEFCGRFITDNLYLETVALVVGSTFHTPPDRHDRVVHVANLENSDELLRSMIEQLGADDS
ncbi:hypothetical protein [Amycolatopsis rifamycinica]|uniref:Pentapeptide repeat-containing protein n=1 Tax=Amycolatopsis rifamycinica TaxID=287986 RepID=A0A066U2H0_9PSEU|nr:hypothetical protein [Amycolatopsis rifamycinica]KDN20062.1 hypothetical protein DV20_23455 [Amycolatopsis rifamycinica]